MRRDCMEISQTLTKHVYFATERLVKVNEQIFKRCTELNVQYLELKKNQEIFGNRLNKIKYNANSTKRCLGSQGQCGTKVSETGR